MRRSLLALIFALLCASAVALSFPALTGRVVDDAHMLSPTTAQSLEQSLADYEQQSTNQVVVATIPSLQGTTIEDYGYQLGRHWGIGQKGKDNGVILLVAPTERKVRIEVGYGLEGTLTDAASSQIIQSIILPDFRQGQMENGVIDGTYAIISALGGKISIAGHPYNAPMQSSNGGNPAELFSILLVIAYLFLRIFILPWWFPLIFPFNGRGGGFGGGGGGFGGGFSGGGGGFGGGGASGGW
jgi:uncharacterized protein